MENFSFRSSTHFSDMFGAFDEFYNSNAMSDMKICVSGKTFHAHRIVLSAGSDYFRSILTNFKDPSHVPVLVINEISAEDIASMIEFLYRGQIVVTRDRVENLRRAASHLRIKGFENFLRKPFSSNRNSASGNFLTENNNMKTHMSGTTLLSREPPQQQLHNYPSNKRSGNGSESEGKRKRNSKQQLQLQQMQQQQQQLLLQQQVQHQIQAKEATQFHLARIQSEVLRQQQQQALLTNAFTVPQNLQFDQMVKQMKSNEYEQFLSSVRAVQKLQQNGDALNKVLPDLNTVSITPIQNGHSANGFDSMCKQEDEDNRYNENVENGLVEMAQDLSKDSALKSGRKSVEQNRRSAKRRGGGREAVETDEENDGSSEVNYTYEMDPTALNLDCWENGDNDNENDAPGGDDGESDYDEEDEYDNGNIANRENRQAKLAMLLNHQANLIKMNGCGAAGVNGQLFYCEHCPKYFFDEDHLQVHVKRSHGVNKLNACNICGKTYAWKSGLYKHKRHVHNICGKTLNQGNENGMTLGSSDNQSHSPISTETSLPSTPTDLGPPSMSLIAASTGEADDGSSCSPSPPMASASPPSLSPPSPLQNSLVMPGHNLITEQLPAIKA